MGIRFDRNYRRATNGPMFFFSIIRDELFEEEIRSAFINGLSFYAYRLPGESMLAYGSSEGYVEGLGETGFVIGRFLPGLPIITIPYRGIGAQNGGAGVKGTGEDNTPSADKPIESTTWDEYSREVEEIIRAIKAGEGEKVVAARVIVKEQQMDVAEKFFELCQRFPNAFVFCFSTSATGCWIGASPELLLQGKEGELMTMALAGTRKVGTDQPWDIKNIEEQRIVADYIRDVFQKHNLRPLTGDTFNKSAGEIEHICTPISAKFQAPGGEENVASLEELLRDLSPTAALCGYPKEFALKKIKELEDFDRGCYGGFCGPYRGPSDFTFQVVLRCASVTERQVCLYVGGGITADSDVASEWEETELKAIR